MRGEAALAEEAERRAPTPLEKGAGEAAEEGGASRGRIERSRVAGPPPDVSRPSSLPGSIPGGAALPLPPSSSPPPPAASLDALPDRFPDVRFSASTSPPPFSQLFSASQSAPFSMTLLTLDWYLTAPHPLLDPLAAPLHAPEARGRDAADAGPLPSARVPILRLFGALPDGRRACLHLHGALPYLYVPYIVDWPGDAAGVEATCCAVGRALEEALRAAREALRWGGAGGGGAGGPGWGGRGEARAGGGRAPPAGDPGGGAPPGEWRSRANSGPGTRAVPPPSGWTRGGNGDNASTFPSPHTSSSSSSSLSGVSAPPRVHSVSLVRAKPIYGCHLSALPWLKVTLYDPRDVRRAADLFRAGAVAGRRLQPAEAHVPFALQVLLDHDLYGGAPVKVAKGLLREWPGARPETAAGGGLRGGATARAGAHLDPAEWVGELEGSFASGTLARTPSQENAASRPSLRLGAWLRASDGCWSYDGWMQGERSAADGIWQEREEVWDPDRAVPSFRRTPPPRRPAGALLARSRREPGACASSPEHAPASPSRAPRSLWSLEGLPPPPDVGDSACSSFPPDPAWRCASSTGRARTTASPSPGFLSSSSASASPGTAPPLEWTWEGAMMALCSSERFSFPPPPSILAPPVSAPAPALPPPPRRHSSCAVELDVHVVDLLNRRSRVLVDLDATPERVALARRRERRGETESQGQRERAGRGEEAEEVDGERRGETPKKRAPFPAHKETQGAGGKTTGAFPKPGNAQRRTFSPSPQVAENRAGDQERPPSPHNPLPFSAPSPSPSLSPPAPLVASDAWPLSLESGSLATTPSPIPSPIPSPSFSRALVGSLAMVLEEAALVAPETADLGRTDDSPPRSPRALCPAVEREVKAALWRKVEGRRTKVQKGKGGERETRRARDGADATGADSSPGIEWESNGKTREETAEGKTKERAVGEKREKRGGEDVAGALGAVGDGDASLADRGALTQLALLAAAGGGRGDDRDEQSNARARDASRVARERGEGQAPGADGSVGGPVEARKSAEEASPLRDGRSALETDARSRALFDGTNANLAHHSQPNAVDLGSAASSLPVASPTLPSPPRPGTQPPPPGWLSQEGVQAAVRAAWRERQRWQERRRRRSQNAEEAIGLASQATRGEEGLLDGGGGNAVAERDARALTPSRDVEGNALGLGASRFAVCVERDEERLEANASRDARAAETDRSDLDGDHWAGDSSNRDGGPSAADRSDSGAEPFAADLGDLDILGTAFASASEDEAVGFDPDALGSGPETEREAQEAEARAEAFVMPLGGLQAEALGMPFGGLQAEALGMPFEDALAEARAPEDLDASPAPVRRNRLQPSTASSSAPGPSSVPQLDGTADDERPVAKVPWTAPSGRPVPMPLPGNPAAPSNPAGSQAFVFERTARETRRPRLHSPHSPTAVETTTTPGLPESPSLAARRTDLRADPFLPTSSPSPPSPPSPLRRSAGSASKRLRPRSPPPSSDELLAYGASHGVPADLHLPPRYSDPRDAPPGRRRAVAGRAASAVLAGRDSLRPFFEPRAGAGARRRSVRQAARAPPGNTGWHPAFAAESASHAKRTRVGADGLNGADGRRRGVAYLSPAERPPYVDWAGDGSGTVVPEDPPAGGGLLLGAAPTPAPRQRLVEPSADSPGAASGSSGRTPDSVQPSRGFRMAAARVLQVGKAKEKEKEGRRDGSGARGVGKANGKKPKERKEDENDGERMCRDGTDISKSASRSERRDGRGKGKGKGEGEDEGKGAAAAVGVDSAAGASPLSPPAGPPPRPSASLRSPVSSLVSAAGSSLPPPLTLLSIDATFECGGSRLVPDPALDPLRIVALATAQQGEEPDGDAFATIVFVVVSEERDGEEAENGEEEARAGKGQKSAGRRDGGEGPRPREDDRARSASRQTERERAPRSCAAASPSSGDLAPLVSSYPRVSPRGLETLLRPAGCRHLRVVPVADERSALLAVLGAVRELDPDMICAHDSLRGGLGALAKRAQALGIGEVDGNGQAEPNATDVLPRGRQTPQVPPRETCRPLAPFGPSTGPAQRTNATSSMRRPSPWLAHQAQRRSGAWVASDRCGPSPGAWSAPPPGAAAFLAALSRVPFSGEPPPAEPPGAPPDDGAATFAPAPRTLAPLQSPSLPPMARGRGGPALGAGGEAIGDFGDDRGVRTPAGVRVRGRVVVSTGRLAVADCALRGTAESDVALGVLGVRVPLTPPRALGAWAARGAPMRARARAVRETAARARRSLATLARLDSARRAAEVARICGFDLESAMSRGSQYRVESLLLRLARVAGHVAPTPSRDQVAGQPGMEAMPAVFEPATGFRTDHVAVLDFQSLYPSVAVAYNLCFSTCIGKPKHAVPAEASGEGGAGKGGRSAEGGTAAGEVPALWDPPRARLDGVADGRRGVGGESASRGGACEASRPSATPPNLGTFPYRFPASALASCGVSPDDLFVAPSGAAFLPARARRGLLPAMLKELLGARVATKAAGKRAKALEREAREEAAAVARGMRPGAVGSGPTLAGGRDGGTPRDDSVGERSPYPASPAEGGRGTAASDASDASLRRRALLADASHARSLQRSLESRQLGLKMIANVTYGYAAAGFSGRMPMAELADAIVSAGRATLEGAARIVRDGASDASCPWRGAQVVYGDTDSMFVCLPGRTDADARRAARAIARAVTGANPAPVRLRFDRLYRPSVLQAKKRYAGWDRGVDDDDAGGWEDEGKEEEDARSSGPPRTLAPPSATFDAKGIETVRRDGCLATSRDVRAALEAAFRSGGDLSAARRALVEGWSRDLAGRAQLKDYLFRKEIRVGGYDPRSAPPAARVAGRAAARDPGAWPGAGDRVSYVPVFAAPGTAQRDSAASPAEFAAAGGALAIDVKRVLAGLTLPALARAFAGTGADPAAWLDAVPRADARRPRWPPCPRTEPTKQRSARTAVVRRPTPGTGGQATVGGTTTNASAPATNEGSRGTASSGATKGPETRSEGDAAPKSTTTTAGEQGVPMPAPEHAAPVPLRTGAGAGPEAGVSLDNLDAPADSGPPARAMPVVAGVGMDGPPKSTSEVHVHASVAAANPHSARRGPPAPQASGGPSAAARAAAPDRPPRPGRAPDAAAAGAFVSRPASRPTLDLLVESALCLACRARARASGNGALCRTCATSPAGALALLGLRAARRERSQLARDRVCRTCGGLGAGVDVEDTHAFACEAADCAVWHARLVGAGELRQARQDLAAAQLDAERACGRASAGAWGVRAAHWESLVGALPARPSATAPGRRERSDPGDGGENGREKRAPSD